MERLEKFILNSAEGKGEDTVIGSSKKASLLNAALLNGSRANVCEFADVNEVCGAHPGGAVIPLVLVVGESVHSTGKEVLEAIAIGYETHRVTLPIHPCSFRRGTHTNIVGATSGAAAASRGGSLAGGNPKHLLFPKPGFATRWEDRLPSTGG